MTPSTRMKQLRSELSAMDNDREGMTSDLAHEHYLLLYTELKKLEEETRRHGLSLFDLHETLCLEARSLMESKNHDYTSGAGDPFANFRGATFLGIHPILGMQLRQQDKMMRIKTFVERGTLKVKGESVKDAIIDQINYLVLQYGYIQEEIDKVKGMNDSTTTDPLSRGDL